MNKFIKNIKVNKLLHLHNFNIPISDDEYPHLIITGKNGSGKTVLLNAIADFLEEVRSDEKLDFLKYRENLHYSENRVTNDEKSILQKKSSIAMWQNVVNKVYGKVEIDFENIYNINEEYINHNFIFAFYMAYRKPLMNEPKNPTKPTYKKKTKLSENSTSEFLNFLSDLKIQEALARNEKLISDADEILVWFNEFEQLLKEIYEDNDLELKFNYKDYSFRIETNGKSFKFTELSDGFAAILDIVADLILRMQKGDSVTRIYDKKGIVLIDEIETHLHLELQKIILPILTRVFPNIQFIITTHSPFVLSSLSNAVAFDLQQKEIIEDLTEYSYQALAEGYFGVSSESSYAQKQLRRLEELLKRNTLSTSEKLETKRLIDDFEKIPEALSPLLKGEFMKLCIKHVDVLKMLGYDKNK